MEHKVLEHFYPGFLQEHHNSSVFSFISEYDKEVAIKVKDNSVGWDTAWYNDMLWALSETELFESRVKSTLITSYQLKDLMFYSLLILGLIGVVCVPCSET